MSRKLSSQLQQQIPEDASCGEHQQPLQLFCEDDQMLLCGQCFHSEGHESHVVFGVQEAAGRYRVSLLQIPEHSGTGCLLFLTCLEDRFPDPPRPFPQALLIKEY